MKYQIGNLFQYIVCICLITFVTTFFMQSTINYNRASQKVINFDDDVDSIFLRVTDVYGNDGQKSLSDFFSENDSLNRMQLFNQTMQEKYDFLECDRQSLLMRSEFPIKDEFREDYGSSYYGINDDIGVMLNSCQINSETYQYFDLGESVMYGDGFEAESYIYNGDEIIDAILGYEYFDITKIGEEIKVNYLSKDITIRVVGFLNKDTFIAVNNDTIFLDRYIIIPSLKIVDNYIIQDESEKSFLNILYSLKNWGYIKIGDGENFFDYRNTVDEISSELNLKYILNESFASPYITNVSNTLNSAKGFILAISIVFYIISLMIYIYICVWQYKKNKAEYAIHLICGCSLSKLKYRVFSKILLQFLFAVVVASIINGIILGVKKVYLYENYLYNESISQIIVISSVIVAIVLLLINNYINHSNIYDSVCKDT